MMNCLCSVEYSFQSSCPEDSIGSATDLQLKMLLDMPSPEPIVILPESEKSAPLLESMYDQNINMVKSCNMPQQQAKLMVEKASSTPKIQGVSTGSSSSPHSPAPTPAASGESVVSPGFLCATNATPPSNSPPMVVVPQPPTPSPQGTSRGTSRVASDPEACNTYNAVSSPGLVQSRRWGNGRSHNVDVSRHSRKRSTIKRRLKSFQHAKSNMEVLAVL